MLKLFRNNNEDEDEEHFLNGPVQNWSAGDIAGLVGIIVGIIVIIVIIGYFAYYNNKKNQKIQKIQKIAQEYKPQMCNKMEIVEAKEHLPYSDNYNKCTCYYDDYGLIRGCIDNKMFLNTNSWYETQLKSAKNAKK